MNDFYNLEESYHYTTKDGKYTASFRRTNSFLMYESTVDNVYLVNNENGHIDFITTDRTDYYDDFTPTMTISETEDSIVFEFTNKYAPPSQMVIELK